MDSIFSFNAHYDSSLTSAVQEQRPFDCNSLPPWLLKSATINEIFTESWACRAAAAGLALAMLHRLDTTKRPLFWLRDLARPRRTEGRCIPYGPGLTALGGKPENMLFAAFADRTDWLKAAVDAARCGGIGALIMESAGAVPELGLTESRRLLLAARTSGITIISLRLEAKPQASVAETRWRVTAAPSRAMAAKAPGLPVFQAVLLRNRSGPFGHNVTFSWSKDHGLQPIDNRVAPLSGVVAASSAYRTLEDRSDRAA